MNQLTVMLNGNGPNGPQHHHQQTAAGHQQQQHHHQQQQQQQQFFTFASQPQGATISLDGGQHPQPQQLVTFQTQGQPMMALTAAAAAPGGSQAYSTGAQSGMAAQQQPQQAPTAGTIQYIITQPQQPTQQPTMLTAAPTQSQFGIVQNLLAAPGMGGMIQTMSQPTLAPNGTIQMAPTAIMAPNGTLHQPSFFMSSQPTTFQIQTPLGGNHQQPQLQFQPQQQQPPQFQLQAPSSLNTGLNSAITLNAGSQIVNGPNGQQYVISSNPTMGNHQSGAPSHHLMTTAAHQPAPTQPIYQFVLPNGQVIQTLQQQQQPTMNTTANTTLISPQLMAAPNGTATLQTQPTAITVPLQTAQTTGLNQTMNFISTGPNGGLTLATGPQQTTTTFITQSNLPGTALTNHQSPGMHQPHQLQNGGHLMITSPSPGGQQLILNTSPQIHHQTLSNGQPNSSQQQSLLIPATSSASNHAFQQQQQHQQHQQQTNNNSNVSSNNNNTTTTMVVLTQAPNGNNSIIPNAVLDQKCIQQHQQQQQQQLCSPVQQQTVLLLTSPPAPKLVNHNNSPSQKAKTPRKLPTIQTTLTLNSMANLGGGGNATSGAKGKTINTKTLSPVLKVKSAPCDQATQYDDHPQIQKTLIEDTPAVVTANQGGEEKSQSVQVGLKNEPSISTAQESSPVENVTVERPSRPSSASSCGSLKIAEEEEEEGCDEEERQEEGEENTPEHDNETENTNDAYSSSATEVDNGSQCSVNEVEMANEAEVEGKAQSCPTSDGEDKVTVSGANKNSSQTANKVKQEDKEGYQSSYGSQCHFTDTEDEEEEETELATTGESAIDGEQKIKLVRKNGLTKEAFDMISNRLLGSDCGEDQTTNDSNSGESGDGEGEEEEVGEEEEEEMEEEEERGGQTEEDHEEEASNDSNGAFAMQTPSPSGSTASAQMEPESTTSSWAAAKEKTITNLRDKRFYNGIDLEPIRLFAREFKVFRQARGLTQSQVCQDLAYKTDGQSYSQSAICRFEKLDITPKSAVKIKPVLESWLRTSMEKYPASKQHPSFETSLVETIKERVQAAGAGQLSSLGSKSGLERTTKDEDTITSQNCLLPEPGKKRKKRTSFSHDQLKALNHFFEKTPKPSSEEMTEIAKILCAHDSKINRDVVRVWFCNKRQALKAKKSNMDDSPASSPSSIHLMAESSDHQRILPFNGGADGNLISAKTSTANANNFNLSSQPLGPIDQNLTPKNLVNLTTNTQTGSLQLTGTSTLPFAFPSPVSAIPLALSNSPSINSKNGGIPSIGSSMMHASLQPLTAANPTLRLAGPPQMSIRTPIVTAFTAVVSTNTSNNISGKATK